MNNIKSLVSAIVGNEGKFRKLSHDKLINELLKVNNGAKPVSVITLTEPKLRKCEYSGRVKKLSFINAMTNCDYEGAVNRARTKEGLPDDFEAKSSFHVPVKVNNKYTPLCRHKDSEQLYLRLQNPKIKGVKYILDNGQEISAETLKPYLYTSAPNKSQGLENTIGFMTPKIENIISIKIDKKRLLAV